MPKLAAVIRRGRETCTTEIGTLEHIVLEELLSSFGYGAQHLVVVLPNVAILASLFGIFHARPEFLVEPKSLPLPSLVLSKNSSILSLQHIYPLTPE